MSSPVCVVVGVGEGNGAALARAFSRTGMSVALLARRTEFTETLAKSLPEARAYACDVSDAASVAETFARMAVRDGCPADPDHPANARYRDGQLLYLTETDPAARADLVVDNADPENPVVRRAGRGRGRMKA